MHPMYEAVKGIAYKTLSTVASCDNSKAKSKGYQDGWALLMDLHDQDEMALFCAHLPASGLSESQRQILLDGLAQEYAKLETWTDFVDACVEYPDWTPSRWPVGQANQGS